MNELLVLILAASLGGDEPHKTVIHEASGCMPLRGAADNSTMDDVPDAASILLVPGRCNAGDAGLAALPSFPKLKSITVKYDDQVTDAGLMEPKSDRELIQGTWEIESFAEAGKEVPADGARFIFAGDVLTLQPKAAVDVRDLIRMKYSLDPSKSPKAIDTSHEIDPGKPIIQLGIYALSGDKLKLCLAAAGKPRPRKFESETGHRLVLKRVNKESE